MTDGAPDESTITIEFRPRDLKLLVALAIPIVVLLVVLALTPLWVDRAKIILSLFMLGLSIPCFWVFWNRNKIVNELFRQEELAEQARDDSMFELTAVRARLSVIEERLTRSTRPNPARINKLLVQQAGAAVMMVIQKEQSFIKWGFWAAKLAKSAFDYFKSRSDH